MKKKEGEGEEEKERLIISSCKVVEYLEPLMSKELLFKFPDNSAFDFDYSQSSIWSPLVPRMHSPLDLDLDSEPRILTFGFVSELSNNNNGGSGSKKVTPNIKKKVKTSKNFSIKQNKTTNKIMASGFSPAPIEGSCAPFATKGWSKVLRAAAKRFKRKRKRDPTAHVKLSNYLRDARN